jgi:hypothetical protein
VLADVMVNLVQLHTTNHECNFLVHVNVARFVKQWWDGRRMDQYMGKALDQHHHDQLADAVSVTRPVSMHGKAVINLTLQGYLAENAPTAARSAEAAATAKLDPQFRACTTRQIRVFVFVRHAPTSSSFCSLLCLLAQPSAALARVRIQHYPEFGSDSRAPAGAARSRAAAAEQPTVQRGSYQGQHAPLPRRVGHARWRGGRSRRVSLTMTTMTTMMLPVTASTVKSDKLLGAARQVLPQP